MLSLHRALTHCPVLSLLPAAVHPRAGDFFPGRLFVHTSWSSPQAGQAESFPTGSGLWLTCLLSVRRGIGSLNRAFVTPESPRLSQAP